MSMLTRDVVLDRVRELSPYDDKSLTELRQDLHDSVPRFPMQQLRRMNLMPLTSYFEIRAQTGLILQDDDRCYDYFSSTSILEVLWRDEPLHSH